MQKFSFALYGLLRKYKMDTLQLAEACNLPENILNDWRCGRGAAPSPGHLIKLARTFSTSRKEVSENHLSLLYAHLLDDCVGPGADYLNIEILPKALPVVAGAWSLHPLRRMSELDLAAIRKHLWYDRSLQQSIHALAEPLKSKPLPPSTKEVKPE